MYYSIIMTESEIWVWRNEKGEVEHFDGESYVNGALLYIRDSYIDDIKETEKTEFTIRDFGIYLKVKNDFMNDIWCGFHAKIKDESSYCQYKIKYKQNTKEVLLTIVLDRSTSRKYHLDGNFNFPTFAPSDSDQRGGESPNQFSIEAEVCDWKWIDIEENAIQTLENEYYLNYVLVTVKDHYRVHIIDTTMKEIELQDKRRTQYQFKITNILPGERDVWTFWKGFQLKIQNTQNKHDPLNNHQIHYDHLRKETTIFIPVENKTYRLSGNYNFSTYASKYWRWKNTANKMAFLSLGDSVHTRADGLKEDLDNDKLLKIIVSRLETLFVDYPVITRNEDSFEMRLFETDSRSYIVQNKKDPETSIWVGFQVQVILRGGIHCIIDYNDKKREVLLQVYNPKEDINMKIYKLFGCVSFPSMILEENRKRWCWTTKDKTLKIKLTEFELAILTIVQNFFLYTQPTINNQIFEHVRYRPIDLDDSVREKPPITEDDLIWVYHSIKPITVHFQRAESQQRLSFVREWTMEIGRYRFKWIKGKKLRLKCYDDPIVYYLNHEFKIFCDRQFELNGLNTSHMENLVNKANFERWQKEGGSIETGRARSRRTSLSMVDMDCWDW